MTDSSAQATENPDRPAANRFGERMILGRRATAKRLACFAYSERLTRIAVISHLVNALGSLIYTHI